MADRDDLIRLTLRQMQTSRWSRRRFIGRAGLATGGLVLSPALLAACGSDDEEGGGTESGEAVSAGDTSADELRISNWTAYIDEESIPNFEEASGLSVKYTEDVNDNESYFAKIREPLSRNQDIGADLFVVTDFLVARLINLGWLAELDDDNIPNKGNLEASLSDVAFDPDRRYSLPWFSGFTGLAYNIELTGREITSVEDLLDPEFAGRVTMFSDLRDGLGMVIQYDGGSVEEVTTEQVEAAAAIVQEAKDAGQIRRFTGNDYIDDLAAGNLAIAQAYSGDVAQLTIENPNLRFVVPEQGGILWSDNMVIPTSTKNGAGAEQWMDYFYDPEHSALLTSYVQFISPVAGTGDALLEIDPDSADNPLINPPQELRDNAFVWRGLSDEEEIEYTDIYDRVVTG